MTNFPNGVSSFGVPILGGGGIPFTGKRWFVDPANGNDNNPGNTPNRALRTLSKAHDKAVAGRNDVVILIGDGGTAATARLTSSLAWSKNATHLVGVAAPTGIAQRARISHLTTATVNINPLMTISASGCVFANFSFFQGIGQATTDEQLIDITGSRNYFHNVHFGGMGHANGAARAGSHIIYLNGGSENTFERCVIGLDTIARSAANSSVKLRGAATRNVFIDCDFLMYATATSPLFVDANAANSIDRFAIFRRCNFLPAANIGSAASPAAVVAPHANQNGTILLDACTAHSTTDWTASDTPLVKLANMVSTNGDTGGEFVNSDATLI